MLYPQDAPVGPCKQCRPVVPIRMVAVKATMPERHAKFGQHGVAPVRGPIYIPQNRHKVAIAQPSAAIRLRNRRSANNGGRKTKEQTEEIMAKSPASPQQGGTPAPVKQQEQGTSNPALQPGQTPPAIRDWASI